MGPFRGGRHSFGESQALAITRPQVSRIENYPQVRLILEDHIKETEGQVARLEKILDAKDTAKPTVKDATLSVAGTMAALGHTPAEDEILKTASQTSPSRTMRLPLTSP